MLMLPIVVPFRRQVTSTPFDPFLVSRLLLGGGNIVHVLSNKQVKGIYK